MTISAQDAVSCDIETTGLSWNDRMLAISLAKRDSSGKVVSTVINTGYSQTANLFGISFGDRAGIRDRKITPVPIPEARSIFREFVGDKSPMVFHNGSFDIPYIVRSTILTPEELEEIAIFDTMVMARCTGSHGSVSLENLLSDFKISTDHRWRKTKNARKRLQDTPYDEVEHYAAKDAEYTLLLAEAMIPMAVEFYPPDNTSLIGEESEWIKLISMMRVTGIQLDVSLVKKMIAERKRKLADLKRQLMSHKIEGPNASKSIKRWVGSINQLSRLTKTAKGNHQISEESLANIKGEENRKVVSLIIRAREINKQVSTWLEGTLEQADRAGRVHPMFTVSGTKSNRLSCKKPNAQAISKKLDGNILIASPGYVLVELDYSQAELRVAASFAREQSLADEFQKEDADPHMATAKVIFGPEAGPDDRQNAKSCNFLTIYGGGAGALVETVNKRAKREEDRMTEAQARSILSKYRKGMPGITKTMRETEKVWTKRGYLRVLGGKRVYMGPFDAAWKAFNFLIQPSIAELIKKAMIGIKNKLPMCKIVNQVHDSVWLEIPDDEKLQERIDIAVEIMLDAFPVYVRNMTSPPIEMKVDYKIVKSE